MHRRVRARANGSELFRTWRLNAVLGGYREKWGRQKTGDAVSDWNVVAGDGIEPPTPAFSGVQNESKYMQFNDLPTLPVAIRETPKSVVAEIYP